MVLEIDPIQQRSQTVKLVFYAQLRDLMGRAEMQMTLNFPSNEKDLLNQIASEFPAAQALIFRCRIAVDDEYLSQDFPVESASQLDLISPISGG